MLTNLWMNLHALPFLAIQFRNYPRNYARWLRLSFDSPPVLDGSKGFPAIWTSCNLGLGVILHQVGSLRH